MNFPARRTDPSNSLKAASDKALGERRYSQRLRVLHAYCHHDDTYTYDPQDTLNTGSPLFRPCLTDEEAGELCSVRNAHKRVSELLKDGLLHKVGDVNVHGTPCRLCAPTQQGIKVWRCMLGGESKWL